jgi:hypothetical protein
MTVLVPEAIRCKSFGYCVMVGYCGRFHQMNMVVMLKVDDESTMNGNPPKFQILNGKGRSA